MSASREHFARQKTNAERHTSPRRHKSYCGVLLCRCSMYRVDVALPRAPLPRGSPQDAGHRSPRRASTDLGHPHAGRDPDEGISRFSQAVDRRRRVGSGVRDNGEKKGVVPASSSFFRMERYYSLYQRCTWKALLTLQGERGFVLLVVIASACHNSRCMTVDIESNSCNARDGATCRVVAGSGRRFCRG